MTDRQKQHLLAYLGYYTGKVDGIWGELSIQATAEFQKDYGLEPKDGIFGAQTREKVLGAIAAGEEGRKKRGDFWEEIEFFDREEFRCTCGGRGCNGFPAEPEEQLVRNAEAVRKHFRKPVIVSSGVRCQLRNSELPGSAANSLHMRGKAMDFCVQGQHSSVTLAYVKTLPGVDEAYAIDGSYVHMGVNKY